MKTWTTLIAVLVALFVAATPAAAQYGGNQGFLIEPPQVFPGDTVSFLGTGCPPGSTVTFTIPSLGIELGSTTADNTSEGNFFLGDVVIPESVPPGSHDVVATCGDTTLVASLTVLQPPTTTSGGGLAVTGSSTTIPMTKIAVGLIAVGGLVLLMTGRRRERRAA